MSRTSISILISAVLLIAAQAVIFNHLVLFNVALALVFIYLIIRLPLTLSTNQAMTIAFIVGLIVDIFSDTAGLNALCCTVLAFVRRPVFHLYMSFDDDLNGMPPSARSMGSMEFLKYTLTMTAIYCLLYFMVEAFQLFNPWLLLMRILCSTVFTALIIYAIDSLQPARSDRRK